MCKIITKIDMNDSYVKLCCEDAQTKINFKILYRDYLSKSYRINQQLNQQQIDELTSFHIYAYGYMKCISKLASSDKSVKEITQILKQIDGLTATQLEDIIQTLQDSGYLKDENVCESQLYSDQNKLLGKRKTYYNLISRGVEKEVANEVLNKVDQQQEFENGLKKAKLYLQKITGKSYKEKIYCLKNKLIMDGFSEVDDIINVLNYPKDETQEKLLATQIFEKAKQKYAKKMSGKELHNAIYKYMATKGFDNEMIKETMSVQEMDYEN